MVKTTEYRSVLYIIKLDLSRYYNKYICIRSSFSTLGLAQLNIWLEGFAVGHTEDEEGS